MGMYKVKYYFKAKEQLDKITPAQMGLEYTTVQRLELQGSTAINTKGKEVCLVVIKGEVEFKCNGKEGKAIFKDMLYVPHHEKISLYSEDQTVIIKFAAPSDLESKFVHIKFQVIDSDNKRHHIYGKRQVCSKRHVWNFIDENFESSRFLIGICEGDVGGWTAWPPHEHAKKREEVYVYFDMGNSFGIQCIYENLERPLMISMVKEGDLVSVPRGYHPNVGCPAGKMSYIYCMVSKKAGERNFMDLNIQKIYGNKLE